MFGRDTFKTLFAAGAVALMAGGAGAATVTYENAEATPKVRLVIDDSGNDIFRFTLTTFSGTADFLALGFDFAGILTKSMISWVSHTPVSSDEPALDLFGDGTIQVSACGPGCNFNGPGGSDPTPYDYIIRIGEQGGNGDNLISSIVFDIALTGSLARNPFSSFGVRAQGTSNVEGSIKYGLLEVPPSTVPVPVAGFLMIGALGGLAALRRRRRVV